MPNPTTPFSKSRGDFVLSDENEPDKAVNSERLMVGLRFPMKFSISNTKFGVNALFFALKSGGFKRKGYGGRELNPLKCK